MLNKFEDQLAYNFNKLLQVRDPDQFNVPNKFLRPVAYQIWTTPCKLACYEEVGTELMIPVNVRVKINRVLHIYGNRANWTYNRRC
jgi:hypothetical protein